MKICGITRLDDALRAGELGASAIGFVFWPKSPRFIDPYRARTISRALPPFVTAVGVFVDEGLDYVKGVAKLVGLGAIQLHGSESVEYAQQIGHRVIRSVSVGPDFDPAGVDSIPTSMTVLLDVHDPARRGGTGRTIDWRLAAAVALRRRVILSGGLTPDNVDAAIREVNPYGVDVSSGVEQEPGVKDPVRLTRFFETIKRSHGEDTEARRRLSVSLWLALLLRFL